MKIYATTQGIILIGKAAEIKAKIKQSMEQHHTIKEWQQSTLSK